MIQATEGNINMLQDDMCLATDILAKKQESHIVVVAFR